VRLESENPKNLPGHGLGWRRQAVAGAGDGRKERWQVAGLAQQRSRAEPMLAHSASLVRAASLRLVEDQCGERHAG
jgi:hypothetical protein